MKVSVALATYNGAEFLEEQLESIRTQTMPADEVRITDDCSRDGTAELARSYIALHGLEKSWSVTVNPTNLGYGSNFIGALDRTSGEYVFFCDQDDVWLPDRLERMTAVMDAHPEILAMGSEYDTFSTSENALQIPQWERKAMRYDGSLECVPFSAERLFIGCQGCTMCIRRALLEKARSCWVPGWAHDEFVWRTALLSDGLYLWHEVTLNRRLHENNASLRKIHDLPSRLRYLEELRKGLVASCAYARQEALPSERITLMQRHIRAAELRMELLRQRKLSNAVLLALRYRDCYHKKRAIFRETLMAIKG